MKKLFNALAAAAWVYCGYLAATMLWPVDGWVAGVAALACGSLAIESTLDALS